MPNDHGLKDMTTLIAVLYTHSPHKSVVFPNRVSAQAQRFTTLKLLHSPRPPPFNSCSTTMLDFTCDSFESETLIDKSK